MSLHDEHFDDYLAKVTAYLSSELSAIYSIPLDESISRLLDSELYSKITNTDLPYYK
jgi:hypothetical protein